MLKVLDIHKPPSLEPTLSGEVVFPLSPPGRVHTKNERTGRLVFRDEET